MTEFTDKVVIITGASEGIGRALALELASQKAILVLAARNEQRLDELKSEIEEKGARALVVPTDVSIRVSCQELIDKAVDEFDRIDVLVNNAGRTMWTSFEEITNLSLLEELIQLNYMGSAYCTYYALPWLKKTKGRIVAVGSAAGLTGVPQRTGYSASKHAMFGFFDSLRIELKGSGVSVTNVAPDFVLSEMHKRALNKDGGALGVSPMQESKIMTSETCATLIVKAMTKRTRLCVTSGRARLARWMKLIIPGVVDNLAAKAIRERKQSRKLSSLTHGKLPCPPIYPTMPMAQSQSIDIPCFPSPV